MSYNAEIMTALATPGGHLSLGRGGFTLYFGNARLSGYDCETIKAEALTAGLALIDSRPAPFELVAVLAVSGPELSPPGSGRAAGLQLPRNGESKHMFR
ncbi:MAG: hypothetical protein JOZ05_16675, partial [Acetobacteraceae bacterium]|nr:hypothetical protein [Acetobacteraceae bacterium]